MNPSDRASYLQVSGPVARIVKSNSHLDYVARVVDRLNATLPPDSSEYEFSRFVSIPAPDGTTFFGVIYNSQLINPDYGNFGPRLSPRAELEILSPDYLDEQGILIGILLLGWRRNGSIEQKLPMGIVPVNQEVYSVGTDELLEFHRGVDGLLGMRYFSLIMDHTGTFAIPLVEAILGQLWPACNEEEQRQLAVLKRSLSWQRTFGGRRL